jgi:hypothetical protein
VFQPNSTVTIESPALELLHLRRGVALGLRHHRDGGAVEIGQHIDGQAREREAAGQHQAETERQNQHPVEQGAADEKGEHGEASPEHHPERCLPAFGKS